MRGVDLKVYITYDCASVYKNGKVAMHGRPCALEAYLLKEEKPLIINSIEVIKCTATQIEKLEKFGTMPDTLEGLQSLFNS